MICPTCHQDFWALVICDDKVHRCMDCKRARPAPAQQPSGTFLKQLRRRDGLCPRCGKPANGNVYCAKHREEYRLASIRRRRREA